MPDVCEGCSSPDSRPNIDEWQILWVDAQEPSACVSEQVTLQLVPWSCAVDDSQKPATLTCTPAYLQLSTEPGV